MDHSRTGVEELIGVRELVVTDELYFRQLAKSRFAALVLARAIAHTAEERWPTEAGSIDDLLPFALVTGRANRVESVVVELEPVLGEPCLALVTLEHGMVYTEIAAPERRVLRDAASWLRQAIPPAEPTTEQVIPVGFWSRGSAPIVRRIAVPSWDQVRGNYPTSVGDQLSALMTANASLAERGRLLLWYGEPGTGKTYALRALGWEWRRWCRLHYVTDPEGFFGERARYMLDVLVGEEEDEQDGWRLVILEDTGELLAADAKEQTGQGLSRLLNVVDGLLGQGLRVLVLMTTNEPLRRLHEAVVRPGRCAAKIHFRAFTTEEAAKWLRRRGDEEAPGRSMTLARLYSENGQDEVTAEVPFGFAR